MADQEIEVHEAGHDAVFGVKTRKRFALDDRLLGPAKDREALGKPPAGPEIPGGLHDPTKFPHVPLDRRLPERPLPCGDALAILLFGGVGIVGEFGQKHVCERTVGRKPEGLRGKFPRPLPIEALRHAHKPVGLVERFLFF